MDAPSNDAFTIVGAGYRTHRPAVRKKGFWERLKGKPVLSVAVFSVIALGCLFSGLIINHDPAEFFLMNVNEAPNAEFWFGTDSWAGHLLDHLVRRQGLHLHRAHERGGHYLIGVFYGCLSGAASGVVDGA